MVTIILCSLVALLLAYRFYGRFLQRRFALNDAHATPAETMRDGVDFEPTSPWVVLGHHFASIAGAGPIVGPILAGLYFGWLPALLWILLGAIFVGGVHDFGSAMLALRHRAVSLAEAARTYVNTLAGKLFLVFIWFTLLYVILVFLDLSADSFVRDGSVASASSGFIFLAVALGFLLKRLQLTLRWLVPLFLPLLGLTLWAGYLWPMEAGPFFSQEPKIFWSILLLGYCVVASILPMWLLLQPRDFLSSFLLYGALIGGGVGLLVGALGGSLGIQWPQVISESALRSIETTPLGPLFPILFITIACGACSGFHSLVSSGTTVRQVQREKHVFRVTYGGMLLEAFVAVIALATVIILPWAKESFGSPQLVFAQGVGTFLAVFGIPVEVGRFFADLAISTFLLTTLDTCTRLSRYIVQEFFHWDNSRWVNRFGATGLTLLLPAIFVFVTFRDPITGAVIPLWKAIWPIFGACNQLLAALALLAVTLWLKRSGKRFLFAALPMGLMLVATMSALILMWWQHGFDLIGSLSVGLFVLAAVIAAEALRAMFHPPINRETIVLREP